MSSRRSLRFLVAAALALAGLGVVTWLRLGAVSVLAGVLLFGGLLVLLLWGAWRLYQAALWKVGRRLAFSYFLIGVLPIPMVAFLLALATYILAGYFLGHLYRDAVDGVSIELAEAAAQRLATGERATRATGAGAGGGGDERSAQVAAALYRDGRRVGGDPRLPDTWPAWLAAPDRHGVEADEDGAETGGEDRAQPDTAGETGGAAGDAADSSPAMDERPAAAGELPGGGGEAAATAARWVAVADHQPTLAAIAGDARAGALAVWQGDLGRTLSETTDVWVRIYGPAAADAQQRVSVQVLGKGVTLKTDPQRSAEEAGQFFAARAETGLDDSWLARQWDRPFLWWGEVPGPLRELANGERVSDAFAVALNAPPRSVRRHLFAGSAEVDVQVWSSLLVLAFLLFDVYLAAAVLAGVMIFALSRAVNRLSRATQSVREGDFSVRIPVRRRDQVGELQRSFNQMAENLEQLVATATQKELLEKELAIARELQQSLLPRDLPGGDGVEFATVFEPSAAIGGDYFDIVRLGEDRLAVIVADVSGHGLPTGLRMAMLKSALTILVSERSAPEEILRKLDAVVRLDREGRFFVTATLALFDFRRGLLELTNAGHPPTYVLSGGGVREVMLPGSPLGGLGQIYGHERLELSPGAVVVWLSDGFVEATDASDEPFGYTGVERALREVAATAADAEDGGGPTAEQVRDHLVAAVNRHAAGRPAEDDRTLVVMRYKS